MSHRSRNRDCYDSCNDFSDYNDIIAPLDGGAIMIHSVTAIGIMLLYLLGRSLSLADLALPGWGDRVRRTTKSFTMWFCTSDRRPEDISIRPEPDHCLPMSLTDFVGHVAWRFQRMENEENRDFAINPSQLISNSICKQHLLRNHIF